METPTDPGGTAAAVAAVPQRLQSLDAFRGAIMLLMASSGFGIPQVAKGFPDHAVWQFLGRQCEHAAWRGWTLWDLIQPSFMFMVGVALPYSIANRRARGARLGSLLGHAVWRSFALVLLAVFLTSAWSPRTEWVFANVLAQIGLGYLLLYFLAFAPPRVQWFAAAGILAGCWLAFALHPLPSASFDWQSVGVPPDWPHLTGFAAHWEKNANVASVFDLWFLNLFPRETPFVFNTGGYATLNFVPSLATMLFGCLAGGLLRREEPLPGKLQKLVLGGLVGLVLGKLLDEAGLCPIVKRIWTPSWALFSAGWVTLLLAGFVAAIEWRGWRWWTYPLTVAGMNPIALYCMWQLMDGFVRNSLRIHFGPQVFDSLGAVYAPILERTLILGVFWVILWWLYRRKIFLRL